MLKYYFKIAWRNIARHKVFTIINVAGLALGVCACIVIFLVSNYELTFDNFHQDKERIYHIGQKFAQVSWISSRVPPPMPAALRQEIGGFEAVAGFYPYDATMTIRSRDGKKSQRFTSDIVGSDQSSVIITDPHFFDIFKYAWLAGNPGTSLNDPFKVVLSESKARTYFGSLSYNNIIGREIIYNDSLRVTVSGIVKDWNKNTDFPFADLISYSSINSSSFLKAIYRTDAWGDVPGNPPILAMVKFSKTATTEQVNRQLEAFVKRHMPANPGGQSRFMLEPLSDIHFNADYSHDDVRKAHKPTLYILMGIALFILLLAVINFINLSTAQAVQRVKEIGVRKVLGSSRVSLILHFLTETFVVCFFAVVVAVLMVQPLLSYFYAFIPNGVIFHLFSPGTLVFILILALVTSLLAGLYPAMVSSSHAPASSLKGDGGRRGGEKWLLRKGLIVFQFSISLIFIIGTFIIGRQVRYMLDTNDYGVKTDGILAVLIPWRDSSTSKLMVFEEKIRQVPGVEEVIRQGPPPIGWGWGVGEISYMGKRPVKIKIRPYSGNEGFIPFYGMRLVAGRNLLRTDGPEELVINETCLKALGFARPNDALGQFLLFNNKSLPIVGVVADFHEGSFHDLIGPSVIGHFPQNEKALGIQLTSTRNPLVKTALTAIEKLYYQIYPSDVNDYTAMGFTYTILNEGIASYYETDQKTSRLVQAAMFVTIFISCLGLFGLALFTARKRTKEISIRKVIGASTADIFTLLTRDFVVLVLFAFLIASPVAWIFMNKWLEGFAYRVTISWWVFALAGSSAVLIALLTVSFQAIKAASANPVKSLRAEM